MKTANTWPPLVGSAECLKWSQRDLQNLEAVLRLTPGRRAVVQAGGNVGVFPKRLAVEFETVYTFEPDADLFAALVQNVSERNVVKLQAALGVDRGPIRVECSRRDGSARAAHAGLTHVAGAGHLPSFRVDDLALPACDLIYLDVEGWELFALQGAEQTLRRCRPVIAVEINKQIAYSGATAEQLRGYIVAHGYRHALTVNSDEVFTPL